LSLIRLNDEQRDALVADADARLRELQSQALDVYVAMSGKPRSVPSLHGVIGGKNNTYVDSVRDQFATPEDFQARWIDGLLADAKGKGDGSAVRLIAYLQDEGFREYTLVFLERNFYKNHLERTRAKPDATLWQLWFGDNKMPWGLLIAPAFRRGAWTNDVSEIRRARYHYWSIGHVLATGVVDPDQQGLVEFRNLEQFLVFYRAVLKRISNSQYEHAVFDRYAAYLERSPSPELEPLLIPELRYGGLDIDHKYRLDFTVLNAHTMEFVGFEFSPFSTHGAVKGMRDKTQAQVNAEGAQRWANEMSKRNAYFADFGISTVTFTDPDLADMDGCFSAVQRALSARAVDSPSLSDELKRLEAAGKRLTSASS
jgi:hypothetical protein